MTIIEITDRLYGTKDNRAEFTMEEVHEIVNIYMECNIEEYLKESRDPIAYKKEKDVFLSFKKWHREKHHEIAPREKEMLNKFRDKV